MTEICAYAECGKEYVRSTHNQKYCSDQCCRTATNLKIREKYYENKARLNGKKRTCSKRGCKNALSRYNSTNVCQECVAKEESQKRNSIVGMLRSVSG
jgi:hypothetical protein